VHNGVAAELSRQGSGRLGKSTFKTAIRKYTPMDRTTKIGSFLTAAVVTIGISGIVKYQNEHPHPDTTSVHRYYSHGDSRLDFSWVLNNVPKTDDLLDLDKGFDMDKVTAEVSRIQQACPQMKPDQIWYSALYLTMATLNNPELEALGILQGFEQVKRTCFDYRGYTFPGNPELPAVPQPLPKKG
jgi:hypothetical protein